MEVKASRKIVVLGVDSFTGKICIKDIKSAPAKPKRKRIHVSFTPEELKLVFKALETLKEAIRKEQGIGYAEELAKLYELMVHIKAVLKGKCRGRRKRIDYYSPVLEDYLKNEGWL